MASAKKETAESYLAALPEARRAEVKKLHELIKSTLPALEVHVGSGMIGYGKYTYRYDSGREGESFRVGLSSRAAGISIYVNVADENGYLPEAAAKTLGKVDVGKSCIRLKKAADLDTAAFVALLRRATSMPAPGESSRGEAPLDLEEVAASSKRN